MNRLTGKVAVVTGASTGIGEDIAKLFASEGAKVAVIANKDVSGLERVAEEIRAAGGDVESYVVDIREEAPVIELYKKVEERFGRIDILVNNAGVIGPEAVPDKISMEEYDFVMNTDARGSFICSKHVIDYMRRIGGGNIINISSICGLKAEVPGLAPYHIAKAALQMMTKVFAHSYAAENIRCNSVNPGTTMTQLIADYGRINYGSVQNYADFIGPNHPMGRGEKQKLGEVRDVAYAALYLASDEAKWVTGAQISVDGGWSVT